MRIGGLALAAALLVSSLTPASAAMRISGDRGGQIGRYLQAFAMLRSSGERVIIDGNCLSACTLVLGMIPRGRICATSRARLGFHAAWMPDADGRPVTSSLGTRALWNAYPPAVRHWIARHGGLSRHMIYLQGRALLSFVPSCQAVAHRHPTRSRHRYTTRRLRYYSASAASDRR
jgi:hypothetical protein